MNTMSETKHISYVEVMLPNLVWISVAMEVHGEPRIKVFHELARIYKAVDAVEKETGNLAWASSWASLRRTAVQEAKAQITPSSSIGTAAEILCRVYPSCPLEVLRNGQGRDEEPKRREKHDWEVILAATTRGMDKWEWQGIALHGALYHYRMVTRKVVLSPNLELPQHANAALENHESEEGKKGASFLRAFAMAEAHWAPNEKWAEIFWNENVKRTECWT